MTLPEPSNHRSFLFAVGFSGFIAICYFLFQYLVIHTATTLDGQCLYTFWESSEHGPASPFVMFVILVAVLAIISIVKLIAALGKPKRLRTWQPWYYLTTCIVLGFWLKGLWDFNYVMRYERGEIPVEAYLEKMEFTVVLFDGPHVCEHESSERGSDN